MIDPSFIGYLLAFVSSIFFGLYVVPRKLAKQSPIYFALLTGLGYFVGSVLVYLSQMVLSDHFESLFDPVLFLSILAGILWASGFVFFLFSIDKIGLAKSNQWKNLQGPIGVILSLILLSEFLVTNTFYAVVAGLFIFLSALFFTIRSDKEKVSDVRGIFFALLSAIFFGSVTVINKFVTDHSGVYAQQVVWSFFIFLSVLIFILANKKLRNNLTSLSKRDNMLGLIGGFLYLGASYFMLQSYKYIPASIGFSIVQLNAIWVIAIGIFYFKEINYQKHYKRISIGFVFAIIGILFLVFAKK